VGTLAAEGWYQDPFGVHEHRWMSRGQPTKLVRDGGAESYDPPPDLPLPGVLVPADAGSSAADDDTGESGQQPSYSNRRAGRAALDAISGGAVVDEPGGDW
jgi:hypothetical protein